MPSHHLRPQERVMRWVLAVIQSLVAATLGQMQQFQCCTESLRKQAAHQEVVGESGAPPRHQFRGRTDYDMEQAAKRVAVVGSGAPLQPQAGTEFRKQVADS